MHRPDVSVLIVTYDCREYLPDCLEALERTVQRPFQVVVADNASTDGVVEMLRQERPDVRVVEMGTNAGFARANNRALDASDGRFVLLLNPDTVVGPGAVDGLVGFLEAHPATAVAAPRLVYPDGTDQGTARAFPTPAAALWGRRSPLTRLFPNNPWSARYLIGRERPADEPFRVDWVSGACMMVRREVLERLGGFDGGFFMHWEDADLCRRIKDIGLEVWCVPDVEVIHHEGGSRRGWPPAQIRHFHYGAYRYYAKHHLAGGRRLLRPLVALLLASRAGALIALDRIRLRSRGTR